MIIRLFNKLSQKYSYTFAISFFSLLSAWLAALYGFYFIYSTVDFSAGEIFFTASFLAAGMITATFVHAVHFGLFYKRGFSGFSLTLKKVNARLENDRLFNDYYTMKNEEIEEVYTMLMNIPGINSRAALFYSMTFVLSFCFTCYYTGTKINNIYYIFLGGFFASIIYGYFTYTLTEYLIGRTKVRMEKILFHRMKNFKTRHLLRFRYKSLVTLVMILYSMILLTIIIRTAEKPYLQISIFIMISLAAIGCLIMLLINGVRLSLRAINNATIDLASGEAGLYFPIISDRELVRFSHNYNSAAVEITEIRYDLEKKVEEKKEELKKAYDRLNQTYELMKEDLSLAKKIQERIMPRNEDIRGIEKFTFYNPMQEIGGDIYDLFELRPGYVRIFLADATGHGIQAGLVTMIIKSLYEVLKLTEENPSGILRELNNNYLDIYESLNVFFTCVSADIDLGKNQLLFASAGHPWQILIQKNRIVDLPSTGKIIGVVKDSSYLSITTDFNRNDKLILYTDGLFEQVNNSLEEFGEDRVKKIIDQKKDLRLKRILESIFSDLKKFLSEKEIKSLVDDITVIAIERR